MLLEVVTQPARGTVEWARLQSSWISQAPSGPSSRTFPSSSYSTHRAPRSTTPKKTRRAFPLSPCRYAYARPFPCAQAGCSCCLVHRRRRREASFGLTHAALLYFADYMELGFHANRHLFPSVPLEKLWNQVGHLVTNRGSRVEVRHVGSHGTADDVVEGRAQRSWTTWPTTSRACRPILWSATRHRYSFNTHLEQLASAIRKKRHLVNLAAHQVKPAERAPRERTTQPRPKAGSIRQWLLQETTHTLSRTDKHYHCESCYSRARVQQCLTRSCPSLSGAVVCTSPTRSFSWTTGAPGFARLVDISRANVPSSSLNLVCVFFPKWAGEI